MNNLSDWVVERELAYHDAGDTERAFLADGWNRAFKYRETDPDQAIQVLYEARQLAEQLEEPWWVMVADHWRLSAMMHFKKDFRQVVELAVRNAVAAARPENAAFPGRLMIYSDLAAAYSGVDPEGYADEVRQALAYLDAELPREPNSDRYLMHGIEREFHMCVGEPDAARAAVSRTMELAGRDPRQRRAVHFAVFNFSALCWLNYRENDWRGVAECAEAGEECARVVGHQMELCEFLAWQAAAARRDGDEARADRLYINASALMNRLGMPPDREYPDAIAAYHELAGDADEVLRLRNWELVRIEDMGRFAYECEVHLKRCALLKQRGELQTEDVEAARKAAAKLRKPEKTLAALERLGAG
jgi:hypothetical protein